MLSSPSSPSLPSSPSGLLVMPPRTHRHATTQQQQQQQPSSSSPTTHARRRQRHPPSKQLLQMREDGSLYDDFSSAPSASHFGGAGAAVGSCSSSSTSGSFPTRTSPPGRPSASSAALHRNASSNSHRFGLDASSNPCSPVCEAVLQTGCPSSGPGGGEAGDDGTDGGDANASGTWSRTSSTAQSHTCHHHRGRAFGSRGTSAQKSQGRGSSSSSHRCRNVIDDVRRASSTAVPDRIATSKRTVIAAPVSTSHTASSGVPGGHVIYYGLPSSPRLSSASPRRVPITAGVFAAAHAPPGSEQTSPAVRAVDVQGRTRSSDSHKHSSNNDLVTASAFPPFLDHDAPTEAPMRRSSTAGFAGQGGDGDVDRGSGGGGGAAPEPPVSSLTSAPPHYTGGCPDSAAAPDAEADPATATATDAPANATPLTYAAVASGNASAGSLHGKRLPQSRVGFSQWRKRTGCSISSGGAGSVLSTGGSVVAAPADSTAAAAQAVHTATNTIAGPGTAANPSAFALSGFPSTPLAPQNPSAATATASASRTTGANTPASTPPAEEAVDGDAGDTVNGLEDEEGGEGGAGRGSRRVWQASATTSLHATGDDAPNALPSIASPAFTVTSAAATSTAATTTMPPLPVSVHRHQPTHLILPLPCARHGQPRAGSDSDLDEEAVHGVRNGGHGGRGGSLSSGQDAVPATATATTIAAAAAAQTKMVAKADAPVSSLHILAPPPASSPSVSELSLSPAAAATTPGAPMLATVAGKSTPPHPHSQRPSVASFSRPPQSSNADPNPTTPTPSRAAAAQAGTAPSRGMPPRVSSTASFFSAAEVLPGLYLGSYADSMDTEALAAHGISLVVNCSLECPVTPAMAHNPHHVRYVQCPLRDHSDEAIAPYFTPVTRIIHEQLHRRQINLHRLARRNAGVVASTTATTNTISASGNGLCGGGGSGGGGAVGLSARATEVPSSVAADAGEGGDALAARLASWTWVDETENVWAVPPSPASPSLSVGGQPSLKEGKRETPRTPSSAPGFGLRFGEAPVCSSTTTSCSPSPLPGRVATFPQTNVAAAAAALGGYASGVVEGSAGGMTTAPAAAAPPPPPPLSSSAFSTTFTAGVPPAVIAAPLSAPALAALSAATSAGHLAPPPVTVVDPRDCGGVLVHCRMGVSRSATFIIAYMILYGPTMAPLEDTASLFLHFLERERRIVEEAGGTANFAGDAAATTTSASVTSVASPINVMRSGGGGGGAGGGTVSRVHSGNASSAFAGALSPPSTPTPVSGHAAGSRVAGAVGSRFSSRADLRSSPPPPHSVQPRSVSNGSPSAASWARRRSPAIPIAASPLHLGHLSQGSSATPSAPSATPTSPIEAASRVCRPCYLMRLREKRMQQHSQRQLLVSGLQEQQQPQPQLRLHREEDEERDLFLALAAANRAAASASDSTTAAVATATTPCECGPACADVAHRQRGHPADDGDDDRHGGRLTETAVEEEEEEGAESGRAARSLPCRPPRTASPSSAPVVSRRGARLRGSWSGGGSRSDDGAPPPPSLLETAYADEYAAQQPPQPQSQQDAAAVLSAGALRTGTVGAATAAIRSAARLLRHTHAAAPQESGHDSAVEGVSGTRESPLPTPPPLSVLSSAQPTPLRSTAGGLLRPAGAFGAAPAVTPTTHTSLTAGSGDFGVCGGGLLGVSWASSNASIVGGGGGGASGALATPGSTASATATTAAPAMTYREAFDLVKRQKPDVNPNIGFVLALRELAGGGDFSFSTSF